ncbi:MAG: Fido protein [Patescibacteria group bacterium]|nr:Fido protein [Patescibacteria group bacterium]
MPKPKFCLDLETCEELYNLLKNEVFPGYIDSFPPFDTRFPGRLESILNSIEFKADRLGQDIFEVASNYYVSINRGHPLQNGNKRFSVIIADVFLRIHGYEPSIPINLFLEVSVLVNMSDLKDEDIKSEIRGFFIKHYKIKKTSQ